MKRALLDAALELVADEGMAAFSLREVARHAGVSAAAPYRHFPDKSALLAAVAEEGFHTLYDMMTMAQQAGPNHPVARFQALGLTYVRFAMAHPAHFRVMFDLETAEKARYPELKAAEEATFQLCVQAIQDGQAAGVMRAGDAVLLALSAWSLVHGLSGLILDGLVAWAGKGDVPAEKLSEQIGEILFTGLMSRPSL